MAVEVLVFDDERETPRLLSRGAVGATPICKFSVCSVGRQGNAMTKLYVGEEIQWDNMSKQSLISKAAVGANYL